MISQMGGGFGHAPCVTRRAYTAPFTRKSDEEVVPAFVAVGAGKAVRKNAAIEIAAKYLFDMGGR